MKANWRLVYLALPLTTLIFGGIMWINAGKSPELCEGVGRLPSAARYLEGSEAEEEMTAEYRMVSYTEGNGPAPEWYDPTEPMAAEWVADVADINVGNIDVPCNARQSESNPIQRTDAGCPDWNVDSTIYGWDGHGMEVWEMELFSRIVYLEFWGTSTECVEAGIDSMLLLWDMGEYGRTMGELLSAQYAPGYYVYSPYSYVWDWDYDAQALAEIRTMCEERFAAGPTWCAPYFRLWYYHEWAVPAYEIDGVFFSVPRG